MYNNVFKYDILRSLGWLSMISHGHTWLSGGRPPGTLWLLSGQIKPQFLIRTKTDLISLEWFTSGHILSDRFSE